MAPVFVSYVMVHYGWRSSFWICAVIRIAAGIVWYADRERQARRHPFVNSAEISFIQEGPARLPLCWLKYEISAPKDGSRSSVHISCGAF